MAEGELATLTIAVLSESPADETALREVIPAFAGRPVDFISPGFRARGWPSVGQVLPAVIRHLHFQTRAHGLVVVVDSDDTVVHEHHHEKPGYFHPHCRLCQLRATFRQTVKKLPVSPDRPRVLRGIGVAVPAIEAWLLAGIDETVTEERWIRGQEDGHPPYRRAELKARVYGTERPSLEREIEFAVPAMRRHARDPRRIEHDFPGFRFLAEDLRQWRRELSRPSA